MDTVSDLHKERRVRNAWNFVNHGNLYCQTILKGGNEYGSEISEDFNLEYVQ